MLAVLLALVLHTGHPAHPRPVHHHPHAHHWHWITAPVVCPEHPQMSDDPAYVNCPTTATASGLMTVSAWREAGAK